MRLKSTIANSVFHQIILTTVCILFFGFKADAQNFGFFASAVKLNVNGTQQYFNTFPGTLTANSINPVTGAPFFTGNLGTFVSNSGQLVINGGEMKTYKNAGGNVCAATLQYRVYRTGDVPPSFSPVALPFFSNCAGTTFPDAGGGPCNGNDQKWGTFSENIDLTSRCPGDYTFEIYYTVDGSNSGGGCGSTTYDSNNGANYSTSFSITSDLQLSASSTAPICAGSSLALNAIATGGDASYNYLWTGPLGFTSTNGFEMVSGLQSNASGTYNVQVTDGCSTVVNQSVAVVIDALPADPMVIPLDPACSTPTGAIIVLTPASGVDYSFDGGSTYGTSNAAVGLAPGTYLVKVQDQVTGCESNAMATTIASAPEPAVATPSSNSTQCSGSTIQLTAANAGSGAQYAWSGPNGYISSMQNPQLPYSASALGTYTLIVTSVDGCIAQNTTDVTCDALPVRLVSFSGKSVENHIELSWEAVDASDFSHFELERSGNGRDYNRIAKILFSDQQRSYSVNDTLPLTGNNYFRLKMVDMDGSNAFSKSIVVKNESDGNIYAYLENPAKSNQIHLITNVSPRSVILVSTSGVETELNFKQITEREWLINASQIPENQISIVKINSDQATLIRKVIKIR